jgi:hypothetical protein
MPAQWLNRCDGTESAIYWKKRAERAPTEFIKALYLAEASKIESSRYNRTKKAQKKSKARVARIEYRKRMSLPPTFEQRLRMAIILNGGYRRPFYGNNRGYYGYNNGYYRTRTYGFPYGKYNTRYLELPY